MSRKAELVELNSDNASVIVSPEFAFDPRAAELILRNTCVAADRITPAVFARFYSESQDTVFDAVNAAAKLAPIDIEDKVQLPKETNAEYSYRMSVRQPLHSFQARLYSNHFEAVDQMSVQQIRLGVRLATDAFSTMLAETISYPPIENTIEYFMGNAMAAATRVRHLREPQE